jgi:hypothetical protein
MVDEVQQFIPAIYNDRSTLRVQITAGDAKHDFELKSRPPR